MKRKGLYFLIALALGGVGAVHAQDTTAADTFSSETAVSSYDGRWYIAPTVGAYFNDSDRNTSSRQFYYGLGFGRYFSPNMSLDLFIDRTSRRIDNKVFAGGPIPNNRNWANTSIGAAARFYARDWNAWRPYALVGIMGSRHQSFSESGWSPAADLGAGLSKTMGQSTDFRMEAAYRYDWDNKTQRAENGYGDWYLGFSVVARFGTPAAAPAPVAVQAPPAAPEAPAPVEEPILPQHVVIDLRGVNFKFDRPKAGETDISKSLAEPTADSMSVLEQAADTLQRYPEMRVTVAGYTDSIGTEAYNQKLSERRAKIVYDYLISHGIDASRLDGPIGHGESGPIADNDTEAGRAQNRRTELQVQ